uniref:porin family protein n=1 Tax=Cellvibrio fontiphilus TaxID=1815559 RepID=UPI002B4BE5E7|nr:porin family protein [Cellvibrio fontiphilus]
MKKTAIALCLLAAPCFAMAADDRGAYLGLSKVATVNDDCSWCDTSGTGFEAGFYFNKIVGIEAKFADTEFDDDSSVDAEFKYFGANIGHTFNTSWVRFYGKAGAVSVTQKDSYWDESETDESLALGVGVTFTPFAHQSGVYFKIESLAAEVFDDSIGYSQLTIGYQF